MPAPTCFTTGTASYSGGTWVFTNNTNPAGPINAQSAPMGWTSNTGSFGYPAAITPQNFGTEFYAPPNALGNPFVITFPAGFAWGSGGMLVIANIHDWYSYTLKAWDFAGQPINVNNWSTPAGLQPEYLTGGVGYFATSNTTSTPAGNDRVFSVSDSSVAAWMGQGGVIPLLMTNASGQADNVAKISVTLSGINLPGGGNAGVDFVLLNVATPVDGILKICKVAGPGVAIGAPFTFTAGSHSYTVPAGAAPGGNCVLGPSILQGSTTTVVEQGAGGAVASISAAPSNRLLSSNLANGTATLSIGSGFTDVTYTDRKKPSGYLEICKETGPSNVYPSAAGDYTFMLNGGTAGTATVHSGTCSPAIEVPAGQLSIQENPRAGTVMTACKTIPSTRQGPCSTSGRTSSVTIVQGDVSTATVAIISNRGVIIHHIDDLTQRKEMPMQVLQDLAQPPPPSRPAMREPPAQKPCPRTEGGFAQGATQSGEILNCKAGAAQAQPPPGAKP